MTHELKWHQILVLRFSYQDCWMADEYIHMSPHNGDFNAGYKKGVSGLEYKK